ncbi:MAG TPA: hypothetical protein DCF45_06585 [Gammaproteobacteria bacterium]|nr:hypothetical protein [Gammaproteobacteria bacterium]
MQRPRREQQAVPLDRGVIAGLALVGAVDIKTGRPWVCQHMPLRLARSLGNITEALGQKREV